MHEKRHVRGSPGSSSANSRGYQGKHFGLRVDKALTASDSHRRWPDQTTRLLHTRAPCQPGPRTTRHDRAHPESTQPGSLARPIRRPAWGRVRSAPRRVAPSHGPCVPEGLHSWRAASRSCRSAGRVVLRGRPRGAPRSRSLCLVSCRL